MARHWIFCCAIGTIKKHTGVGWEIIVRIGIIHRTKNVERSQVLIDGFESEGFIWGGKWLYSDTMHFEYRPELYLLRDSLAK